MTIRSSIAALEALLLSCAKEAYSDAPVSLADAELRPLLDLSLGALGSELPIRLGGRLKKAPVEIAAVLKRLLPEGLRARCTEVNGHLNFSLPAEPLSRYRLEPVLGIPPKIAVGLAPRPASCTPDSYARLALRAALHSLFAEMAGAESEVLVRADDGGISRLRASGATLAGMVLAYALEAPVSSPAESASTLGRMRETAGHIWLAPDTVSRKDYVSVFGARSGAAVGPCLGHTVTREWLGELPPHRELRSGGASSDELLFSLLLYLGGETPFHELDLFIPTSSESANLWWFLSRSVERAEGLMAKAGARPAPALEAPLSPLLGHIWLRLALFEEFLSRAALHGEVGEAVTALSDLLVAFRRLSNEPSFRIRLETRAETPSEREILYGVTDLLKSIIDRASTALPAR